MTAFVLSVSLGYAREANLQQTAVFETVITNVLSKLSRVALFTAEYGELQPYVEEVVLDPHVMRVVITNEDNRVVVSSDTMELGKLQPMLLDSDTEFWRSQEIHNASGYLGRAAVLFSHASLYESNREALDRGLLAALVGMTLIAIVGVLIGILMTRKLEKLTVAVQGMEQGNLDVVSGISGRDEIGMLGRAFDSMAASLRSNIQQLRAGEEALRAAHDDLEQRIRERTRELAVARDQAFEASRAKSAFLANMSHELRTPLNAIIGYSDILAEEAQDPGQGMSRIIPDLKNIRSAGSHLLSLINDVLDLSKIEAGKVEFNLEDVAIRSLVDSVAHTVQPLLVKNANTLRVNVEENIGEMHIDVKKLRQILLNLLSNAAKFTHQGEVTLRVATGDRADGQWIEFAVEDTGIGIPEDKLDRLFNEFSQADNSAARMYEGTGLGLAISRKLCVMMGGDIAVSTEAGVGSMFVVYLPRAVVDPRQFAFNEGEQHYEPTHVRFAEGGEKNRRQRIARILVIDDDQHMIAIMQRVLRREGFEMLSAASAEEGLQLARQTQPEVIVLDIMLPDRDGWAVLKALKADPTISHIPVIILTMGSGEGEEIGFALGASHYMRKPLDKETLLNLLRECVRESS